MPTHRIVSIDELSQYLHLPVKAAAKELCICLTSFKKLCRQHGITRWPYSKLKSIDKKFAKADGSTGGVEDPESIKARAEEEKMALVFSYWRENERKREREIAERERERTERE
jgi:hypothetical protein